MKPTSYSFLATILLPTPCLAQTVQNSPLNTIAQLIPILLYLIPLLIFAFVIRKKKNRLLYAGIAGVLIGVLTYIGAENAGGLARTAQDLEVAGYVKLIGGAVAVMGSGAVAVFFSKQKS